MCITLTLTGDELTSPAHTQVPKYNFYHIQNKKLIHGKSHLLA